MERESVIDIFANDPISTGTTLVAMEFNGGVVVGTDSRTSTGTFIASRATDKITPITDHLVLLRAGSAADTQAIADIGKYYLEVYSYVEEEKIGICRSAQIFRNFLYRYRDELSASVIVAGYDEEGGQVYVIPLGGYVTRQHYASSGSGSSFIQGYLDNAWKKDMSEEECKNVVKNAVALAIHRDGSSGGVVRLAVVNKDGTKRLLFRPDRDNYPKITEIPAHLTYPKHIIQ